LSDESLLDYYTFYLSVEYKQQREKFDAGYSLISKMHGSDDELEMRRKQNEDFIAPILEAYLINSNLNKLRMLDYGGGAGQVAPSFEWVDVDLYDVGDRSIKSLSNKISKDIRREATENHKSSYDFVQLLHVIEHVGNPLNIVRSAVEFMKNDGLILVEVPWEMFNFDELSQRNTIFCDEHINKFCDLSLMIMMKSLGLKVLSCEGDYIKLLHINLPLRVIRCLAQKVTPP
jgi:2-polyprenyl-3-methyl-5-hydroxy-6-metoxy-1,4-benzoquinol methylase